ncbi:MAG TPA: hypothetical protein VGE00_09320 [Gammaproteobacteria bacterium]
MVTVSRRVAFAVALLAIVSASAFAAKISDITNTKHNLSSSGPGTVKATGESQICVFCHTPHKANAAAQAPLWNRKLSEEGATPPTYTPYTSESLNANLEQPGGSSKLCLSCHDGTMAIGEVGVLGGQENVTIEMASSNIDGSGATTGFTRNLGGLTGTDLTNDHPISFTYDNDLATADGELVDPATASYIGNRVPGAPRHPIPLEDGKVQCVACHDPHIRDEDPAKNAKFLRLNRFQESASVSQGSFNITNDQVCLGCHIKSGWSGSAHANSAVSKQTYTTDAATQREFDAGLPVWQAACLNCHDTHTVQGARRLLREGTDSTATPKAGGAPALEETCYQCHDDGSGAVLSSYATVPNIKTDFGLTYRMPISSADQAAGEEMHAITDKDFAESTDSLGKTDLNNRHAECTDCHNPHRVIKNRLFNADPASPDDAGTHTHTLADGEMHTNLASGVLAGATGVEPTYGATAWGSLPSYTLKKGYGGQADVTDPTTDKHVTREYQVCLKCHSDYAWNTPPNLGGSGLTPSGTNGVTQYTNQAMEFQAPAGDKGEKAAGSTGTNANHRSWHPVIDSTGRTAEVRKQNSGAAMDHRNFLAPWNDTTGTNIGNQTMYCSDCHGSDTALQTVVPTDGEDGNPWGPHGSSNPFLLKGTWTNETGAGGSTDTGICFKCHDWNQYANNANTTPQASGFSGTTGGAGAGCQVLQNATTNMHVGHARRLGQPLECTWCHVAVPHGWKNKQLLIDISTAGGSACAGAEPCNEAPYILGGYLGGNNTAVNWRVSGEWTSADCGGQAWMAGNANGCNAPQ